MSFTSLKFLKYKVGKSIPNVLIDAVHAEPPQSDLYTGEIVISVTKKIDCNCIVATVSRTKADLNRPPSRKQDNEQAIKEYRQTINKILSSNSLLNDKEELKSPFLHLAIHGMMDKHKLDVEIGTRNGKTCSSNIQNMIIKKFMLWSDSFGQDNQPKIGVNKKFRGDISKTFHRHGDKSNYSGYGKDFNSVQIEFSHYLRSTFRKRIIEILSEVSINFANQN